MDNKLVYDNIRLRTTLFFWHDTADLFKSQLATPDVAQIMNKFYYVAVV